MVREGFGNFLHEICELNKNEDAIFFWSTPNQKKTQTVVNCSCCEGDRNDRQELT